MKILITIVKFLDILHLINKTLFHPCFLITQSYVKCDYIRPFSVLSQIYKGVDSCYNQEDHQKHFFKFKVSSTFSRAEIQEKIHEDAVHANDTHFLYALK